MTDQPIMQDNAVRKALHGLKLALENAAQGAGDSVHFVAVAVGFDKATGEAARNGCQCPACAVHASSLILKASIIGASDAAQPSPSKAAH